MRKLLKWYMTWRVRHVFKLIGKIPINVSLMDDGKKAGSVKVHIMLFMSSSGRRKVEWPSIKGYKSLENLMSTKDYGQQVLEWKKGGDLPEDFVPTVDDGFKQLLRAIVDQEMGLRDGNAD